MENNPTSYQAIYVLHYCNWSIHECKQTRNSLNLYECILYRSYHYFYKISVLFVVGCVGYNFNLIYIIEYDVNICLGA